MSRYYCYYDVSKDDFEIYAKASFNNESAGWKARSLDLLGENNRTNYNLAFYPYDGKGGQNGFELQCKTKPISEHPSAREIITEVTYDKDGKIISLFGIYTNHIIIFGDELRDAKEKGELYVVLNSLNGGNPHGDIRERSSGEAKITPGKRGQTIVVEHLRLGGKKISTTEFPLEIDIEALRDTLFPPDDFADPFNTDPEEDYTWKNLGALYDLGFSWRPTLANIET